MTKSLLYEGWVNLIAKMTVSLNWFTYLLPVWYSDAQIFIVLLSFMLVLNVRNGLQSVIEVEHFFKCANSQQ